MAETSAQRQAKKPTKALQAVIDGLVEAANAAAQALDEPIPVRRIEDLDDGSRLEIVVTPNAEAHRGHRAKQSAVSVELQALRDRLGVDVGHGHEDIPRLRKLEAGLAAASAAVAGEGCDVKLTARPKGWVDG